MPLKYVLIADPDQKTLVKLEESLRDVDVHVSVAPDGALALERALTVRHDLFLFSDRLPIIDTPKLAEILRANPRTANVPLVLLRNDKGAAAYGDGSLAKPVQREALVNAVLRYAFKIGSVIEGGDKLSGLLSEMPVPDLLQVLRANRREGMLEIAGMPSGTLWMRNGEVVEARSGKAEGAKALFRLLEAREGRFSFKASKVSRQDVIDMALELVLMEAARQRDEIERLRRERPLCGRLVLLRELTALPEGLHPVHRELLLLGEFYGTVEAVVENAKVTDLEAELGLRSLVDAGIVGLAADGEKAEAAGLKLDPALAMHLKYIAGHSPRRNRPVRIAVFLSASSVISGLDEAVQPALWIKNQDRVLGNQIRRVLDAEFNLVLECYPPGARFAPLVDLPAGELVGALVVANAADDKELDYLNESARLLAGRGLPVEYVFHGEDTPAVEWIRKAFDLPAGYDVRRVSARDYAPLVDAIRAVVVRRATATGWSPRV